MSAPSPAPAAAGALLKSIDSLNSRSKNSLRFTNSDGKLRSSGLEILVEDERRMRLSPEVIKLKWRTEQILARQSAFGSIAKAEKISTPDKRKCDMVNWNLHSAEVNQSTCGNPLPKFIDFGKSSIFLSTSDEISFGISGPIWNGWLRTKDDSIATALFGSWRAYIGGKGQPLVVEMGSHLLTKQFWLFPCEGRIAQ